MCNSRNPRFSLARASAAAFSEAGIPDPSARKAFPGKPAKPMSLGSLPSPPAPPQAPAGRDWPLVRPSIKHPSLWLPWSPVQLGENRPSLLISAFPGTERAKHTLSPTKGPGEALPLAPGVTWDRSLIIHVILAQLLFSRYTY